jgi:hypothetical protein
MCFAFSAFTSGQTCTLATTKFVCFAACRTDVCHQKLNKTIDMKQTGRVCMCVIKLLVCVCVCMLCILPVTFLPASLSLS